jgi:hypothetical protein
MLGSSNLVAMSFLAWPSFFSRVLTYEKQNRTSSELQQLKIVELNFLFVSITSTQSIPSIVL